MSREMLEHLLQSWMQIAFWDRVLAIVLIVAVFGLIVIRAVREDGGD